MESLVLESPAKSIYCLLQKTFGVWMHLVSLTTLLPTRRRLLSTFHLPCKARCFTFVRPVGPKAIAIGYAVLTIDKLIFIK